MRDLWDQARSCPGHALMMMPEQTLRRKEQLSDKAPNDCMELGLLGMVLVSFCLCRHQVRRSWEKLGIVQSEVTILQLRRDWPGEVRILAQAHVFGTIHRCPLWVHCGQSLLVVCGQCALASLDAGTGHLQPEVPAEPVGGGSQKMVPKRELVLGTRWTDREGHCAVGMSSLRTALLPLTHQCGQGCLGGTLG